MPEAFLTKVIVLIGAYFGKKGRFFREEDENIAK